MGNSEWIVGLALVAATTACSNDSSHPAALGGNPASDSGITYPVDSGTGHHDSGGPSDAGAEATLPCHTVDAGCNFLQLCGPPIYKMGVATGGPIPMGGVVPLGVYREIASISYNGPGGMTGNSNVWERETFELGYEGPDGGLILPDAGSSTDGGSSSDAGDASLGGDAGDGGDASSGGDDSGILSTQTVMQDMTENYTHSPSTYTLNVTFDPSGAVSEGFFCPNGNGSSTSFTYDPTTKKLSIFQIFMGNQVTGEKDYQLQ
jgi:hypothetical protein